MSLKSLFNKSVIKSDLRRYWYLSALFAGMIFLCATLPARTGLNRYYSGTSVEHFVGSWFESAVDGSIVPIIIFCIIIPAMLFS